MKLSWNEIELRAKTFVKEWGGRGYEKGDTHIFYIRFFEIFGMRIERVASFEAPVKKLGNKQGFLDLFWPGTLMVEQKSKGRSLKQAKEQAYNYFPNLTDAELPRYLLLCDFEYFELYDLKKEYGGDYAIAEFRLEELPQFIMEFNFIRGDVIQTIEKQEAVSVKASLLMASLHDLLKQDGYGGVELQILLTRLVFCLFADNTGIFHKDSFYKLILNRTSEDGGDLGRFLGEFFDVLNTPEDKRQKSLDRELGEFPYINGALFQDSIHIPTFNKVMRQKLVEASKFDWRNISPAILGALFQSILDENLRREQGTHYTSHDNILKVIGPLFLDDLKIELQNIIRFKDPKNKNERLKEFHNKISKLTFLDPACGCGNFLVITYKEMRSLETQTLKEIYSSEAIIGQQHFDVGLLSRINVDKFYGIEIESVATRVAQIALWMTDHLCNIELGEMFGQVYNRIPLKTAPHIICGDALEIDWSDVIAPNNCHYILGNPPFVGASMQSDQQTKQLKEIVKKINLKKGGGVLDYVSSWFFKAGEYLQKNKDIRIAFVSTNSITQGEQVAPFWVVLLYHYHLEMTFAHKAFKWHNEAKGKAQVHCVIIGLCHRDNAPKTKRLFEYETAKGEFIERECKILSPYLIDGSRLKNPHILVKDSKNNLCDMPKMLKGLQPTDDGNYIFNTIEMAQFLKKEPKAHKFFRPFIGAHEFINNKKRYILNLEQTSPKELNEMPEVKDRIERVRQFRLKSKKMATQRLASTPTKFDCGLLPTTPFLVIPEVSSGEREYIPIGHLGPPIIASNRLKYIENPELWYFSILISRMHMAWIKTVARKMGTGYLYSIGICYNPFPWPLGLKENIEACEKLTKLAKNILDTRAKYSDSSLADLYNPTTMPPDLLKAHQNNDKYVDSLYQKKALKDDNERVELLLTLYENLVKT